MAHSLASARSSPQAGWPPRWPVRRPGAGRRRHRGPDQAMTDSGVDGELGPCLCRGRPPRRHAADRPGRTGSRPPRSRRILLENGAIDAAARRRGVPLVGLDPDMTQPHPPTRRTKSPASCDFYGRGDIGSGRILAPTANCRSGGTSARLAALTRQGNQEDVCMTPMSQIKDHMDVVGSDGMHVGTVDHMEGQDRIKLYPIGPGCRLAASLHSGRLGRPCRRPGSSQHGGQGRQGAVALRPFGMRKAAPRGGLSRPAETRSSPPMFQYESLRITLPSRNDRSHARMAAWIAVQWRTRSACEVTNDPQRGARSHSRECSR